MEENILEVLVTKFVADLSPLQSGLTQAAQQSQQAGVRIGQGLQAGIDRTNLKDDGVKLGRELTAGLEQGIKQGGAGVERAATGLTASLGSKSGGGLGGAFTSLTAGASGLSAGLGGVVGALGPVGAAVTSVAGAVTAATAVFNNATAEFARFQKGIAGVSTLTEQMPGQLGQTGQAVLNLSRDLGMSYSDLTSGLQDILGASVRGTESMTSSLAFLKDAAKLAIAGQTDTAVATDALTTVLNSFKLSAADSKMVSDGLFRTVQDGKVSFNVLAGSIGNVTNIAAEAGIKLPELNAAIATMTANGIQGSTAVDYLRSALTAIIKPSDEAQKLADKLGIQFDAQALKSKGLTGVLKDVQAATKGSTEQMAILFGGVEAMSAATAIASGNFDRMEKNLKNQAEAAGTTETAYTKMAGTLSKQNDKVDASWKALMVNLGNAFAPFKSEVLSGVSEMIDGLNRVLEKYNLARSVKNTDADIVKEQAIIARNAQERADLVKRQGPAEGTPVFGYLQTKIDALDASTKAAQARLAQLQADAAQARADQTAYNVANSSALLPKGVQGPNMGGSGGAATPVQVVTGRDLVTLLGMGGRTVLNEFGVSGKDYHHDGAVSANATHNGIDYGAKRGSAILAPFTGELSVREDAKNGKIFELVDQAGNKIVGIHLDSFDKAVLAALNAGGGKAIIGQGTRIGGVGNTGTTAGSAPHLHLMGYAAGNSRPVDPTGIKFQGMGSAEYGVDGSKPYPSPTSGGSTNTDTDDKAAKNRAAIQKEIDASVAKGKVDAAQRALAELKRLQAEELDAAKDNATKRAQVIAQTGPQIIAAEARIARAVRDQAVQAAGQWAKEQLAKEGADAKAIEAERVRRVREAYAVEAQAKKQAQSDQARAVSSAQDAADKDAERRTKDQAALRARVANEARQLTVKAAQDTLNRIVELNRQELAAFKGTGAERVALVKRQADDVYAAQERAARAIRDKTLAENANGPQQNRVALDAAAKRAYDQAVLEAQGGRADAVRVAQEAQAGAVRSLRSEYSRLADSIREQAQAGTFDAEAKQKAVKAFNELGRAAKAAGLDTDAHITGARKSVWGLVGAAEEATFRMNMLDFGGAIINPETGKLLYQTDAQVRGIGVAAEDTTESYFDLGAAIENVGLFSRSELTDLVEKSGLAADEAERLLAAWEDIYGGIDTGPQLADNLQGRGVTNEPSVNDPAFGVLTDGERQTLISQMDGLNLDQIGEIYAGLVLKGLENSDLGKLIADYLQGQVDVTTQSLLDNGGMTFDPNGNEVFQSNADVRGMTTPGDGEDTPFDLSSVDVTLYGTIEELNTLIETAKLGEDAAQELRAAWLDQNEALLSVIKGYDEAGNAIYYTDQELRDLGVTTGETSEDFFDLQGIIDNFGNLSRAQLEALMVQAGLTEDQIKKLREEYEKFANTNIGKLTDGFNKLSNAVSGIFKSFGGTGAAQITDSLGEIATAAGKIGPAIDDAKAKWEAFKSARNMGTFGDLLGSIGGVVGVIGAAINAVVSIGNAIEDMSSSLQAWKKGLREVAEEQKKVLGMSSGGFKSPWADALAKDAANRDQLANSRWYQRLWWGLTGGGPQAISDEAAKLLTELQGIFAQLGDGIANAFTDAMLDAFNSGDMGNFAENFSKSFDQVVGKVVLKTMIDAAITQGAVAGDLAELTKAIQEQRYGDIPAIMTKIKADAGVVAGQLGAVLPSIPGFGAGADGGSGADGADNRALFGNAPTAQLGIPRFEISLPDSFTKPLGEFASAIPAFSRATDRLYEAADMIVRANGGLQRTTGLAPL